SLSPSFCLSPHGARCKKAPMVRVQAPGRRWVLFVALASACAGSGRDTPGVDLPLGDRPLGDLKADDTCGAALTCKPVPDFPTLSAPRITISIDGLTLHLVDGETGYDKVFPVGVGKIDADSTSSTFGQSLSAGPIATVGEGSFRITPAS